MPDAVTLRPQKTERPSKPTAVPHSQASQSQASQSNVVVSQKNNRMSTAGSSSWVQRIAAFFAEKFFYFSFSSKKSLEDEIPLAGLDRNPEDEIPKAGLCHDAKVTKAAYDSELERLGLNRSDDLTEDDFKALQQASVDWYKRGRKRSNFYLKVSILLANKCVASAKTSDQRGEAQNDLGNALLALGKREKNKERLEDAVSAYNKALEVRTRNDDLYEWVETQNRLATALKALGVHEKSTARLEDAVKAYDAVLKVRTRDNDQEGRAETLLGLGDLLLDICVLGGGRRGRKAALEKAREVFWWAIRAAGKKYDDIYDHRMEMVNRLKAVIEFQELHQEDLGNEFFEAVRNRYMETISRSVLKKLGLNQPALPEDSFKPLRAEYRRWFEHGRKGDTFCLEVSEELARKYFHASAKDSDQRGEVRNDLGIIRSALGARKKSTGWLTTAVFNFEQALQIRTRDKDPHKWAETQNGLATALRALGELEKNTERLETAVFNFEQALQIRTRDKDPHKWAETQNGLATALRALGELEKNTERLETAVFNFEQALQIRTRDKDPHKWAETQNGRATALGALGELEKNKERLEAAVKAYRAVLKVRTRKDDPAGRAETQNGLAIARGALWELEKNTERLEAAVRTFRREFGGT